MGQQQLLLIVLGVIIVGIAIVVGINMFQSAAIDSNRNAVIKDLLTLSSKAKEYYKKPPPLGGGGTTFAGFVMPTGLGSNANGTYTISVAGTATGITFQGIGTEKGNDGSTKVKVTAAVTSSAMTPTIVIAN